MSAQPMFASFGDLYRAAYAELDPTTKQLLLTEVKRALDRWQDSARDAIYATPNSDTSDMRPLARAA